MSAGQLADALGVKPVTVRSWAAAGRVPCERTAGGHRRFDLDAVRRALGTGSDGADATVADPAIAFLRDRVRRWAIQPVSLTVFGSTARGTAGRDSDIDILLVRPTAAGRTWAAQRVNLTVDVWRRLHRDLQVVETGVGDLAEAATAWASLLVDVVADGVLVAGTPLAELIGPYVRLAAERESQAAS